MTKLYRWFNQNNYPTAEVTISNIARDTSGISYLNIITNSQSQFSPTISDVNKVSQSINTATVTFNVQEPSNTSSLFTKFNTKVNYKSGGQFTDTELYEAYMCVPATNMEIHCNADNVWSNDPSEFTLTRTLTSSTGSENVWGKNDALVNWKSSASSNDCTLNSNSYVSGVSTKFSLRNNNGDNGAQTFNREFTINFNAYSDVSNIPSNSATTAGPNKLTAETNLNVKNAVESINASKRKIHLPIGQSAEITAYCNPHKPGTVYSSEVYVVPTPATYMGEIWEYCASEYYDDTLQEWICDYLCGFTYTKNTTNSYSNTSENIIFEWDNICPPTTVSITSYNSYNPVSDEITVICSNMPQQALFMTYYGDILEYEQMVAFDYIVSQTNPDTMIFDTFGRTLSEYEMVPYRIIANSYGINNISFASGAQLYMVCSSLPRETEIELLRGESISLEIYNDILVSSSGSSIAYNTNIPENDEQFQELIYNSIFESKNFSTTLDITAVPNFTTQLSPYYSTNKLYFGSDAKIIVYVTDGWVSNDYVCINTGDIYNVEIDARDIISSVSDETIISVQHNKIDNIITITALKPGDARILLRSGASINVHIEDITFEINI